ncbi:hypothetical protein [Streptomyces regalis]|uniref:Serine/arginine repetitive matrix protein 2 n=1 Tax=Streptomyces regalis TaxID=68262 RepID=A0A117MQ75_9ACTN|nr:hypothetical protein [Streptomyces regalis]KUL29767.1 hypothetical protein ADL12_27655 [Streptomyces regalis]
MSGTSGDGGIRWNDETQRWETAGESGAVVPPTSPPPPVPAYDPSGPGDDVTYAVTAPPDPLPRSRHTTALIAGATVAVVAGGIAFGVLALQDDGTGVEAGTDAASVVSASQTATSDTGLGGGPADSGPPTDTPSPTELPSDFVIRKDPAGFTIAVPKGWVREERENGVFYTALDDPCCLVQIYVGEADITPYEALRRTSEDRARSTKNYEEISLRTTTEVPGQDGAELVYAYDLPDGTRRQVVDRAFVAENGEQYAVLMAATDNDWPGQRQILQVALDHFAP